MPKTKTDPPSASEKIRAALEAGHFRAAILSAAKFQHLGDQRDRILSAREAYLRPDFQRALNKNPDALIADGIQALRERYGSQA
jgi:hypothetical protein